MGDDVQIEFDEVTKETDAAYEISIDGIKAWLPKSQVRMYPKTKKVFIPEWLALKKGLV